MACQHGQTIYDAAYLELTQRKGLALTTVDRDLIRAATGVSIWVSPNTGA